MITLVPNKPYATPATTGGFSKPQSNNFPQQQQQHLQNNHHSNGREPLSPKSSMSVSPPPASVTPPKSDSPRDPAVSLSQASLKQRVNMVVMRMIAQNSDHDQRQQTQGQRQAADQAFPQAVHDINRGDFNNSDRAWQSAQLEIYHKVKYDLQSFLN